MKDYTAGWDRIKVGQIWRSKALQGEVTILKAPAHRTGNVKLLHRRGTKTLKQVHYFLYDYEPVYPEARLVK